MRRRQPGISTAAAVNFDEQSRYERLPASPLGSAAPRRARSSTSFTLPVTCRWAAPLLCR